MTTIRDWLSKPPSFFLWWIAPIAVAVLTDMFTRGWRISVAAWAVALAWMGVGCALNAWRCHRRHCYLSSPTLLVGASMLGLQAAGAMSPNVNTVLWGTFGLVLLSFAPELIWGRYLRGSR